MSEMAELVAMQALADEKESRWLEIQTEKAPLHDRLLDLEDEERALQRSIIRLRDSIAETKRALVLPT